MAVPLTYFRTITEVSQIKETDYMVILFVSRFSGEYVTMDWNKNIVEYKGEKYVISIMKGMYANFLKTSKQIMSDKEFLKKFKWDKDIKIAFGGHLGEGRVEFFAYKNWDAIIADNLVFTSPHKVEVEINHEEIIRAIETNEKFYSPSHN